MELLSFKASYAAQVEAWFPTREESLMWGGRVFGWPISTEKMLQRSQEKDLTFFVLLEKEEVVGFIEHNKVSENEMRLCRIAINPAFRGKGYGKKLVQLSVDNICQHGKFSVVSLAVFQHNVIAKKCYESFGFQVSERGPHFKIFDGEEWPLFQMVLAL
ncbi:GNAT family N-acetyltransferase [Vibrio penaeicida]|uniref:GNAT family N-acetyltransferase n=1 Tax=Vibrio penaeicida TaxID=104609 RepID=UPI000CEA5405|nr:GNAT family N-acetyltransferase [Vibrio penaeicida]